MEIREARFPTDLSIVRVLFREYAEALGIDLSFQNFEAELAELPGRYGRPAGGIWLAEHGAQPAGCAAFRPIDVTTCEMKRLYVRPAFRGRSLGRRLAEQIISNATAAGYQRIWLDTMPSMGDAIRLYRLLGFSPIEAYCHNPIPGALFLGLDLRRLTT
jgi:GNAT superfamily N-acetyltransferase